MLAPSLMASSFSDCNGQSRSLVRDDVSFRLATLAHVTSTPVTFWSDTLRNCLLTESEMFLDRAIYNLCAGKNLVSDGKLSWAIVTFYYSSFFSVHGLVRLQMECYPRISGRFYHLTAVSHESELYSIKRADRKRSHGATWHLYNRLYSKFPWQAGEYLPVLRTESPLWDVERRHDANYDLAAGYQELRLTQTELRREVRRRRADVLDSLQRSLSDDDLAVEAKALLRAKLLAELLGLIASRGPYRSFFEARQTRRRAFVGANLTHAGLRSRLLSWLS
jgi:hypothetical protein